MSTVGPQRVADLARQMGVTADLPAVPALVLGVAEVSVLDMASAFSTLANRGWHVTPQSIVRIEDAEGHTVWEPVPDSRPVLREQEADQVTATLRGVIGDGTGTKAAIHLDAAGKTGTTEDARDAWFVGYTCNLTTAVWMGFTGREGQVVAPMKGILGLKEVTGGSVPATMWSTYMDAATEGVQECDLTPTGVEYGGRVLNAELATGPVRASTPADPGAADATTSTSTSAPTSADDGSGRIPSRHDAGFAGRVERRRVGRGIRRIGRGIRRLGRHRIGRDGADTDLDTLGGHGAEPGTDGGRCPGAGNGLSPPPGAKRPLR